MTVAATAGRLKACTRDVRVVQPGRRAESIVAPSLAAAVLWPVSLASRSILHFLFHHTKLTAPQALHHKQADKHKTMQRALLNLPAEDAWSVTL